LPIQENEKKNALFVSTEPLDGLVRVSFYTPLVKDIIYRALYGLPLFGEKPPNIDLSDYAGVIGPLGLQKWKKNTGTISRRPEDQIVSCQVASAQDVLLVLRDPKVAPWWQFAQCFSLFHADPSKIPNQKQFKKIIEDFRGQIPDDQIAVIMSKYDVIQHKSANGSVLVPTDFEYAYKEFLKGNRNPFNNFQKNNSAFHQYFESLRGLVNEFLKIINAPSFQMYNPAHV
jgi:hypothetical protein